MLSSYSFAQAPIDLSQINQTNVQPTDATLIDPKVHYIDEEKMIIEAFLDSQSDILHHEEWIEVVPKNLEKYRCKKPEQQPILAFAEYHYTLPMYPTTGTENFQPLRLIKISHLTDCENYYVYLQEKVQGKWVYKYNQQPLGMYYANGQPFVPYLTAQNIEQVLRQEQAKQQMTISEEPLPEIEVYFENPKNHELLAVEYQQHFALAGTYQHLANDQMQNQPHVIENQVIHAAVGAVAEWAAKQSSDREKPAGEENTQQDGLHLPSKENLSPEQAKDLVNKLNGYIQQIQNTSP
ncbi:MAG: hypothetical protein KDK51_05445 [Deltaproteobacteria bacterium]|nr:hypothetical protein [Deltaproteobacteria bacterium]